MPIVSHPHEFNEDDLYVDLGSTFGRSLYLKCEGFNFAGSIKLKAANEMVEAAERDGVLQPDSILVESSSGNLGVALSMIVAIDSVGSTTFGRPFGPQADPRSRHQRPPAAARRVLRRRGAMDRGSGHDPHLPPPREARLPVRRLDRDRGQRRDLLARGAGRPRS